MSRYNDGYSSRGRPADYYTYSTTTGDPPPSYSHLASPGGTTYNGKPQQARLTYEPQGSSHYPPRSRSHSRPRSLAPPPAESSRDNRERGDNKYGDTDDSDDGRTRSPVEKAKRFVDSTFTDSTTGLGVGVLGALVGGLAAREAVDLTSNQRGGRRHGHGHGHGHNTHEDDAEHRRNQLISTVVGAAVGALGANAVEKRIEVRRARDEIKQEKWERKWRRPEGADAEVLEKMEVVARPQLRARSRSRGGGGGDVEADLAWGMDKYVVDHGRDHYRDFRRGGDDGRDGRDDRDDRDDRSGEGGRRGIRREVDPAARSWKNVEDWRRGLTP